MRENTKWIMLITALAFVGLMVFEWGMDMTGQSGTAAVGGELGRVNGEPIMYQEYMTAYNNLYTQQSQAVDGPITPVMRREIEESAWQQLVTQKLISQELRRRGLGVSDEEIRQAALDAPPEDLRAAPIFQDENGQFDPARYREFLATPSVDENFLLQLEAYYRDVIPRSKLYFQNMAGLYVSDGQLWRMYSDANETATVDYVAFNPDALIPDSEVSVSDAEIRTFYDANSEQFVRPAQANVRYVAISRAPTPTDTAAALRLAGEYRTQAVAEPFDRVALRAGAVNENTRLYGEQFSVGRGQSAPALDQAVFNTPVGEISQPVLTQAGYHLVKVESRGGDTAQVRQIVVPVELSRAAEDRVLDRADSLETAASSAGLEQAARQLGLQIRTAELSPALPVLPGVGTVDDGVDWAFEDAAVGETSDVLESNDTYYVLELLTRQEEGLLTVEEASPAIRPGLVRTKKIAKARELLAAAERRARGGESLQAIAGQFNGQSGSAGPFSRGDMVAGLGRVNAAVGAPFGLTQGQTSPLVEADDRLFLIRTTARQEASPDLWKAQLPEQRQRVLAALAETRWSQFVTALRESADIVDNREEVMSANNQAVAGGTAPSR